jgi:ADP-heptose:LPS heptosyltransferase
MKHYYPRQIYVPPIPQAIPLDLAALENKSVASMLWRHLRPWLILWANRQTSLQRESIDAAQTRLLWIYKGWPQIGDALMDLSSRRLLKNTGIGIDLYTDPHLATLFEGDDVFSQIFSDENDIDANRYDLVIIDSFKARCLNVKIRRLARLPFVTMHGYFSGPEFNRTLFSFFRLNQLMGNPNTEQEIALLAAPYHAGSALARKASDNLPISPRAIAFAVGGEKPERTYERWDNIVRELFSKGKIEQVVLLGSGNGRAMGNRIIETVPAAAGAIVNCIDQFSLVQTFEIMKKCRFLVCCDGGLLHLANAARLPTVALFNKDVAPAMRLTTANASIPLQSPGSVNALPERSVIGAIEKALLSFP